MKRTYAIHAAGSRKAPGRSAKYHDTDACIPEPEPLVLTEQQRSSLNRQAGRGIIRALVAQGAMLVFAVLLSWWWAGGAAAVSAMLGAGAYFVPNALFALRLLVGLFGPIKSSPFTFFMGEAFKLGSAILVLGLAAWLGRDWVVWPALLFGLVCVLKGYVLLLMFRKLP